MGGGTSFEKFEEVRDRWEADLQKRSHSFENEVYSICLGKNPVLDDAAVAVTRTQEVMKNELSEEDMKKVTDETQNPKIDPEKIAKPTAQSADGKPVDMKEPAKGNVLVVLYNQKDFQVQVDTKTDFSGLKMAIEKISEVILGGIKDGAAAATSPLAALKSLTESSETVTKSIGGAVAGALAIASSTSSVGISQRQNIQYVAPGIYVATLTFSATTKVETWKGTENAVCYLVQTIIATSTDMLNSSVERAVVLAKLTTLRKGMLNTVKALGRCIGVAEATGMASVLWLPPSASFIKQVVDQAKASKPPKPAGPAPDLSTLNEPSNFSNATDYNDQLGKYEGFSDVLLLFEALFELAINAGIQGDYKDMAKAYKVSLEYLGSKARTDYIFIRDETAKEEQRLMGILEK